MGVAPDSTHLREMSRRAASIDYTRAAMEMVGETVENTIPRHRRASNS